MYNRHPRLPQALNACETDSAFELADPEEELELKLAGVKPSMKRFVQSCVDGMFNLNKNVRIVINIFLSLRYGKTLKRRRETKKGF